MRPGKIDARAVEVSREQLLSVSGPAGGFSWLTLYDVGDPGPHGMYFRCPCGCGGVHSAMFDTMPAAWREEHWKGRAVWHWDGNVERPTLTPSLGLKVQAPGESLGADGYHWHGFLRAGVFEQC